MDRGEMGDRRWEITRLPDSGWQMSAVRLHAPSLVSDLPSPI